VKNEESRRLFFALWPDNTVRAALQEQAKIMRADTDGRAVAESNLHVTLAFLGKVPLDLVSTVCAEAGCIRSGSFDLEIDQTGWWKKTGILWLAPSALPAGLNGLVHSLWDRLHPLGFKADFHKFRPHVTIARKCSHSASAALEPISWAIKNFALLESETHPKGARYRVLDQWSLNPGDDTGKGGCPDGRIVE
jgi:2'-5' RNA ligase